MRLAPMWLFLMCACMGSPDALPWCSLEAPPAVDHTPPTPTWHGAAHAIVARKCTGCHASGGSAPFELTTYDDVAIRKEAVRIAVETRAMPPWQADRCCNHYFEDRSLDDAVYFYKYKPKLLTGGKRVLLQGVTPHMHTFGSRITVRVLRATGEKVCLLEIPKWRFGWEQPFWLAEEIPLEPDDELYVECHFDNSAENQPAGQVPKDFAWGGDGQDMCAAFVSFVKP